MNHSFLYPTDQFLRYVIANDLSSAATEAMRRNVEINGLGPEKKGLNAPELFRKEGKVRVNEGDAWWVSLACTDEKPDHQ